MATDQYLVKKIIDHLTNNAQFAQPTTLFLSLFVDADCLTEVSGGSYARQTIALPAVAVNQFNTSTTSVVTYTNMPAGQVAGAGIHDAVSSGNRFFYVPLPAVLTLAGGDTVTFNAGQLVLAAQ